MAERFMVYLTDLDTMKNEVVPSSDYDPLAARYDRAVELLGKWLDGLCPSADTEDFLQEGRAP
jgi:hypothetical protein